jgi:hypothetical protein
VTVLSGLRFRFEPEDGLSPAERQGLRDLESGSSPAEREASVVRVRLEHRAATDLRPGEQATPARLSWEAGLLRVRHAQVEAEIDAGATRAILRRDPRTTVGLITVIRTALSARLPLEGGLVLHAAGLEHEGRALVFFGPSGIGKTTLAQRSPWPMLSDELVALLPRRAGEDYQASGTSFRRPLPGSRATSTGEPRLAALVELAQGPRFHLTRHEPRMAMRRVLGSICVPPGPPFWTAALAVVADLAQAVPCYRMAWTLDESPFEALADAIAL